MSELVADCPRCKAERITFKVISNLHIGKFHTWQNRFEAFCICKNCNKSTVFVLSQTETRHERVLQNGLTELKETVNNYVKVDSYVSIKDMSITEPPEYLPKNIDAVFKEGSACMSIGCHNAAATMFRLSLDLATKSLLPTGEVEGLNGKVKRNLGFRLPWLFDNGILPEALRDLATCIKDDGNDGAHEGILGKEDAEDILDFTFVLLERLFTEPKRIELAKERRLARHKV